MEKTLNNFFINENVDINLESFIYNLIAVVILTYLIKLVYNKYSQSLSNKDYFSKNFVVLGITTCIVITIVKSSLALSLGLVGALSIVRFRTPIKEPEELGYLFLTIAIGLGFGAGFSMHTIIITFAILAYLYFAGTTKGTSKLDGEYTLLIKLPQNKFSEVSETISNNVTAYKLIRSENNGNKINAYFNISVNDEFNLQELINDLKNSDDDIEFNMVESGVNW